jgi:hypothetical protein
MVFLVKGLPRVAPRSVSDRRSRVGTPSAGNGRIIQIILVALVLTVLAGVGLTQLGPGRPTTAGAALDRSAPLEGGWQASADGRVWGYGGASSYGSVDARLHDPIVGMAATPDGYGYWLVASDGGIFSFGDATFYGSTGAIHLNRPIVGMAATPDGHGYWLVASDGGIFSFGDATFYGSTGNIRLNRPIVGMAATPDGHGYWLVASDGGTFSFGDATFYGSTGNIRLNRPIVGMTSTGDGRGYWLVASDGGIFTFGDAAFYGSEGGTAAPGSIVGMQATPDGQGYWVDATDGAIAGFGDASSSGPVAGLAPGQPIVGMAAAPGTAVQVPQTTTTSTSAPTTSTTTTTVDDPFVTVCGTQLCLDGQPWYMASGTAYGHYSDPTGEAALLTQANLNTSELVNFDSQYRNIAGTEDSATWNRLEAYIGQMGASGHHVLLNLSEFFAAMETAGMNPYSPTAGGGTDFSYQEQYLAFVAAQSVNGVPNGENPTIAKVELWGEPVTPTGEDCISSPCQDPASPQAMLTWYSTLEAYWHSLSPVLISSGGFSHLDDGNSGCTPGDGTYPCPAGVPWQQISDLPYNATADIEDNSANDQQLIPGFAGFATTSGRPWTLSAWSACLQTSEQPGGDDYTSDTDASRHVTDMLDLAAGQPVANYPPAGQASLAAAGFSFWNLGNQAPSTCQIGPTYTPLSFAALSNGPR